MSAGAVQFRRTSVFTAPTETSTCRGRDEAAMSHRGIRVLVCLATVAVIAGIVAVAVGLFRGSFTEAVPVTIVSQRAGLVMNPDAKVKMRGVQVGKVASIESRPNGQAALHLAMDPSEMHLIPANVVVDLTSP